MENKSKNFIFHENNYEFHYKKKKTNIDIRFNRVAFIFFVFFIISVIYSIHLLHLGSRKDNHINQNQLEKISNLQRPDIVDRNGNYIAKTVSSIDIGINPIEVIDQKKLLLNLGYIFPDKNYEVIKSKLKKKNFFGLKKKFQKKIMKKL